MCVHNIKQQHICVENTTLKDIFMCSIKTLNIFWFWKRHYFIFICYLTIQKITDLIRKPYKTIKILQKTKLLFYHFTKSFFLFLLLLEIVMFFCNFQVLCSNVPFKYYFHFFRNVADIINIKWRSYLFFLNIKTWKHGLN